jgi:ribosomal-protein-alanine N-acetyltransferase
MTFAWWPLVVWQAALDYWTAPALIAEEAHPQDAARLADIHLAAFPGAPWSVDDLAALLREETVFGLVARRANVFGTRLAVGFVLVRSVAGEAEILTLAVDPGHRRRGVALALMETAMRRLYGDRVEALFLEVDAGNLAAVSLYRRLKFRVVGERRGYYVHGSVAGATALVMRSDLR